MGASKALLDWQGRPLLLAVMEAVRDGVDGGPVVVVHAVRQELPELPEWAEPVCDSVRDEGPLRGLHDGLVALADRADSAFVATVDAPFLRPKLVRLVLGALAGHDAAMPLAGGRRYPLTAAYRTSAIAVAAAQLDAGKRRVLDFVDLLRVRLLDEGQLAAANPGLRGLVNVNTPEELEAALRSARV